jgi:uncharacterized protein (TIGR03435 family)
MPAFMTPRVARQFGLVRNLLLGATGMLAMTGLLSPPWSLAQSTAAVRPEFEAASIKPSVSGRGGAGSIRDLKPGSLTYTDRNLFEYIRLAYGVEPYQVTHGPAVSLAERYDIVAKAAGPVPVSQVKLMLRSLLVDRFKLTIHRETRVLSVYILTVAKGGPRFQASEDDGPMSAAPKNGSLQYRRTTMAYLAGSVFSNLPSLGCPVVDRTGLDGIYDFSLKLFDPASANGETGPKGDMLRQIDDGLSASLKDLGLKLESQKSPVEILVIDHVERPSEN